MADQIPTPNAFTPQMQAQFNDLMALSTGRAARQEPIHQAAMAMATRMAPNYARDAMSPVRTPSAPVAGGAGAGGTGTPGGGGMDSKAMMSFLAAMLPALAGGGGDLSSLLALIKKLFGIGGGGTVQGDKPGLGGIGPVINPRDPFGGFAPDPFATAPGPSVNSPTPNVGTDYFFNAPWPETSDPFKPFDPGMLPGGNEPTIPGLEKP